LLSQDECAALLAQSLTDENLGVRLQAAWAFARRGDPRGADTILELSRVGEGINRRYAIEALADLGTASAESRLREIVRGKELWAEYARLGLVSRTLRPLGSSERRQALLRLAETGERLIAEWATDDLLNRRDGSATELLDRLRASGSEQVNQLEYLLLLRGQGR